MSSSLLDPQHYFLNPFALPPLAVAASSFLLGAAVVIRERGSRASWSFLWLCAATGVWLLGFSLMYLAAHPGVAFWWANVTYVGIPLIPPAIYHFTARVLGIYQRRRWVVRGAWALFAGFALLFLATDIFFAELHHHPWGFYPRFRVASVAYVAPFVGLLLWTLRELWAAYRAAEPGTARLRARAFLGSFAVAYLALIDFFPAYGVELYPIGFLPVFAFLAIAAWAVWRFRLADLSPAFVAGQLVRTMPDMLAVCDARGRIHLVNPAFCAVTGYGFQEPVGQALEKLADGPTARAILTEALRAPTTFDQEVVLRGRSGEPVDASLSAAELLDQNGFRVGTVLVIRDVRERKRMEGELVRAALFDRLTGLPNRELLLDRIGRVLAHARRRGVAFAVVYVDLNGFEIVKDTLGHAAADEVLVRAARRLTAAIREADTVARLEGDRFGLVLRHVADAPEATRIARRLQQSLAAGFIVEGQEVFLNAGIGIAHSSTGYDSPEEMLRDAHAALGRAMARGPAGVEVFDREMRDRAVTRLRTEAELREAVEVRRFRLLYQPIVSLDTGEITAFEALLRWQRPGRGLVGPEEFLAVAEETGLIVPLGRWTLERACCQLRTWQGRHPAAARLRMHVNLSAREVARSTLWEKVDAALRESGLEGERLVLEITETTLMERAETVLRTLGALRSRGVHLCVDDFGTGYSSLSYLRRFPVEILKIDRSFVGGTHGRTDVEIVRAILALGESLRTEVVAEGIETEEQAHVLRSLGCRYGQGYLFSPPLEAREVPGLLRGPHGHPARSASEVVARPPGNAPAHGAPDRSASEGHE